MTPHHQVRVATPFFYSDAFSFSYPRRMYPTSKSLRVMPRLMAYIFSWSRVSSSILTGICTIFLAMFLTLCRIPKHFTSITFYAHTYILLLLYNFIYTNIT